MGKQTKKPSMAASLGITIGQLDHVRAQVAAAERGLASETKARRKAAVARRLQITPGELSALRAAITGQRVDATGRLIVRRIAALPSISSSPMPTPVGRRARGPAGTTPGGVIKRGAQLAATTRVYVTPLGDAVHQYADCHGMRGFRHAREKDPEVVEVLLRDRVCADRRACLVCLREVAGRVDTYLDSLHGKRGARLTKPVKGRPGQPVNGATRKQRSAGRKKKKPTPASSSKRAKSYWLWDR